MHVQQFPWNHHSLPWMFLNKIPCPTLFHCLLSPLVARESRGGEQVYDEVGRESERDDGGDDADDDHGSLDASRLALPLQAERALIHRHYGPRVVRVYTHLLRLHRLENKTHNLLHPAGTSIV